MACITQQASCFGSCFCLKQKQWKGQEVCCCRGHQWLSLSLSCLLYCCDRTPWPRQLVQENVRYGARHPRREAHDHLGGSMAARGHGAGVVAEGTHLKAHPQWHVLQKARPPNPSQIIPWAEDQVFKSVSLWGRSHLNHLLHSGSIL